MDKFKVYFADTGFLVASLDDEAQQLISSDRYPDIEHGIKLSAGNVGIELPIVTFPYYCAFLLRRYINYQTIFK